MDNRNDPSFHDVENEPTPYGLGDATATPGRRPTKSSGREHKNLIALVVGIGCGVLLLAAAGFVIAQHSFVPPKIPADAVPPPSTASSSPSTATTSPQAAPTITIGFQKTPGGVRLVIRWGRLPNGTESIDVYYSQTADGAYQLIGTISISSPMGGNGYLNVPSGYQNGYYYGVASGNDDAPLWTSSSSPPVDNNDNAPSNGSTNSSTNNNTENNNPPQNNDNGSTTNDGGQGNNTNSGQASSSAPGDNFMVEYNNGRIQISWQSIPSSTYELVISRSASDSDPWAPVLTETDIVTDGPYSILIGDDTVGDSYYYRMDAYDASGTDITTFGPTLLSPL